MSRKRNAGLEGQHDSSLSFCLSQTSRRLFGAVKKALPSTTKYDPEEKKAFLQQRVYAIGLDYPRRDTSTLPETKEHRIKYPRRSASIDDASTLVSSFKASGARSSSPMSHLNEFKWALFKFLL